MELACRVVVVVMVVVVVVLSTVKPLRRPKKPQMLSFLEDKCLEDRGRVFCSRLCCAFTIVCKQAFLD